MEGWRAQRSGLLQGLSSHDLCIGTDNRTFNVCEAWEMDGQYQYGVANGPKSGEDASTGSSRVGRLLVKEGYFVAQAQATPGKYIDAATDVAHILEDARLPGPLSQSIWGSLTYFLERDGDPIEPDLKSLQLLLAYIADHKDWRPPGLGLDKDGVIEAVWEAPNVFRWSLEFLPVGEVQWTYLEKNDKGGIMRPYRQKSA
jgi:hypothetical protein